MAEVPRLTRSLRAFSGVGLPTHFATPDELRQELAFKRRWRNEQERTTWQTIKQVVARKCPEKEKKNVRVILDSPYKQ